MDVAGATAFKDNAILSIRLAELGATYIMVACLEVRLGLAPDRSGLVQLPMF
ncbi:hypothetical protein LX81_00316 [Palleronia aestuarii]|uniref:Uncharacterized protein n=1 Tax=Palleronia aestuarii TaxID=568105 RepID=A0A2W7NK73_9RHOB|nr:hypothetical protein LX81_00316 [Palleronia aestuarii]